MNIKFCYLYRDASNYKQFNEIVFANPNQIPSDKIQAIIRSKLIEECWFIAKDWNVPDLHFKEYSWDNDLDHEWHEFDCVEETTEAKTVHTSIDEFIERI
jgi:hypothetical protein